MADPDTTVPQGEVEPAVSAPEAPAATTPAPADVEQIVSQRLAEWEEKRIKPLQKLVSERDQVIQQLKTATMSEEEREQQRIEDEQRRIADLETENWLLKQAQRNPTAVELFQKVLSADDPEAQFALFEEIANRLNTATTPTPTPEPELSETVPDIDRNNPAPAPSDYATLPDGTPINRKLAEDFFAKLGSWPIPR